MPRPRSGKLTVFIGEFTATAYFVLGNGACIEWDFYDGGFSVSVRWHEPERPRSVADPLRGGTYTKAYPLELVKQCSGLPEAAEFARIEARKIARELQN